VKVPGYISVPKAPGPPSVCGLMVTANRPMLAGKVLAQFLAQTYPNRYLLILDSGKRASPPRKMQLDERVRLVHVPSVAAATYGALINLAGHLAMRWLGRLDYFAIFDDDDWSHPQRIEHQVGMLDALGGRIAGYHSMYFLDERDGRAWRFSGEPGYAIGASLMFDAVLWAKKPWADEMIGADSIFQRGERVTTADGCDPIRMVARIHAESVCARAGHRQMRRYESGHEPFAPAPADVAEQLQQLLS